MDLVYNPSAARGQAGMGFIRSIVMHADGTTRWPEQLGLAAELARSFDAELTTVFAAESVSAAHPFALSTSPTAAADLLAIEEERLARARVAYADAARDLGGRLRWVEGGRSAPAHEMICAARCADLLVLAQSGADGSRDGGVPRDFVASVLLGSGRPSLVLPDIGVSKPIGRTVLVAWKATRESARALSAAIPFLQRAERVELATWVEDDVADAGSVTLDDPRRYLALHGISVGHCSHERASPVGEAMLSLASDVSADLLVMGCYGHSRARERILGGATRRILESMTVPVLLSH